MAGNFSGGGGLPIELSLTDAAALTGISRRVLERRAERGVMPTVQPDGPGGKRFVTLHTLKTMYPGAWESIVLRGEVVTFDLDGLDA